MSHNPYLKFVSRKLGDAKKFPHRLAGEYPEEWLCRILESLEIHMKERGVYASETDQLLLRYTIQYTITYLQVAQVALKATMAERVKFLMEHAVLSDEERREENRYLRGQVDKLRLENRLLAQLVRAKTPSTLDRLVEAFSHLGKGSPPPAPAARPSSGGLIARSAGPQMARRQAREGQEAPKDVGDYLRDVQDEQSDPSLAKVDLRRAAFQALLAKASS